MEIKEFNPEALSEGRIARGMNQTDLAEAIGLTRQAVSSFELGFKRPSFETLTKISKSLSLPGTYFTKKSTIEFEKATATFYRKLQSAIKIEKEKADKKAKWGYSIYKFISRHTSPPEPNLPEEFSFLEYLKFTEDDIEQCAEEVRKHWGLGFGPISNVMLLLEKNGLVVIQIDMPSEINAFSFWLKDGVPVIVCSNQVSAVRNRFNLAHELGHLLFHKGVDQEEHDLNIELIEAQANRFAGAFLFPRNAFCEEVYSKNLNHLIALKKRWKVAIQAMFMRGSDLGIISQDELSNAYRRIGGRRKNEPLDDELELERPSLFLKGLKTLLEHNLTTKEDFKREMSYNNSDLSELVCAQPDFFSENRTQDSSNIIEFKPRTSN